MVVPVRVEPRPNGRPIAAGLLSVATAIVLGAQWVYSHRYAFVGDVLAHRFSVLGYDPTQPLRFASLASVLAHVNGWHWLGNLLGLWLFGWWVEGELRWWRFLLLALGAHWLGVSAQAVSWQWLSGISETPLLVGMSTIVAFAMAGFCVRFPHVKVHCVQLRGWRWRSLPLSFPLRVLVWLWLGWQVLLLAHQLAGLGTESPVVAHLTTFLFGISAAYALGWHRLAYCDRWRQQAIAAEQEERWSEAARCWQRVAEQQPENPSGWVNAALAWLKAGEIAAVQQALHKALAFGGWDEETVERACQFVEMDAVAKLAPETLFALAEQLERHRRFAAALSLFQKVVGVAEFKRAPQALLKVAELYWRLGEETRALHALHRFWFTYAQTPWRQEAVELMTQWRQRGD